MKEAIETRELFELEGSARGVRGTYHKVRGSDFSAELAPMERNNVGIVFLNSLSPTRAANGDLAVHMADTFAKCGYPSFRIDLPGFGDSDGDPPSELHDYINRGDYAAVGAAAIQELTHRFELSGMIVVGHCAGALTALYTAGASKECCGLIMTSPYFFLPPVSIRPKIRRQLSNMALRSRTFRYLRYAYDGLRAVRLKLRGVLESSFARSLFGALNRLKGISSIIRRDVVPENANRNLLRCWKEVVSGGLPVLILMEPCRKPPSAKAKVDEFDYIQHILSIAGRKNKVTVGTAEGADHSFANRLGKISVLQHTEQWLRVSFPQTKHDASDTKSSPLQFGASREVVGSTTSH